MKKKSVQSKNPCKSLPCRQAGVIQTTYDIVKVNGGELKIETKEYQGSAFIIQIPIS